MSISLEVQSRNNRPIRKETAGFEELKVLAMSLPDRFLIAGIDPCGDTYFNMIQLRFLLKEIAKLAADRPEHAKMLQLIKAAAEEAISAGGYLRFVGD